MNTTRPRTGRVVSVFRALSFNSSLRYSLRKSSYIILRRAAVVSFEQIVEMSHIGDAHFQSDFRNVRVLSQQQPLRLLDSLNIDEFDKRDPNCFFEKFRKIVITHVGHLADRFHIDFI